MKQAAWEFKHSIECMANKKFVWAFWTKVSNWERLEGAAVEWIRLQGPFAEGTIGATKMPDQEARYWKISHLVPKEAATIEMPLEGAVFYNRMSLEALASDRTLITQTLSLDGPKAQDFIEGMKIFESTAPQGLAKLAKTIAADYSRKH